MLELVYKVVPTILLATLNLQIIRTYKKLCERRHGMTLHHLKLSSEVHGKLSEEKRLLFLLGSTSLLFLVCVSPMVVLNITLSSTNLSNFYFQVIKSNIFITQQFVLNLFGVF